MERDAGMRSRGATFGGSPFACVEAPAAEDERVAVVAVPVVPLGVLLAAAAAAKGEAEAQSRLCKVCGTWPRRRDFRTSNPRMRFGDCAQSVTVDARVVTTTGGAGAEQTAPL